MLDRLLGPARQLEGPPDVGQHPHLAPEVLDLPVDLQRLARERHGLLEALPVVVGVPDGSEHDRLAEPVTGTPGAGEPTLQLGQRLRPWPPRQGMHGQGGRHLPGKGVQFRRGRVVHDVQQVRALVVQPGHGARGVGQSERDDPGLGVVDQRLPRPGQLPGDQGGGAVPGEHPPARSLVRSDQLGGVHAHQVVQLEPARLLLEQEVRGDQAVEQPSRPRHRPVHQCGGSGGRDVGAGGQREQPEQPRLLDVEGLVRPRQHDPDVAGEVVPRREGVQPLLFVAQLCEHVVDTAVRGAGETFAGHRERQRDPGAQVRHLPAPRP